MINRERLLSDIHREHQEQRNKYAESISEMETRIAGQSIRALLQRVKNGFLAGRYRPFVEIRRPNIRDARRRVDAYLAGRKEQQETDMAIVSTETTDRLDEAWTTLEWSTAMLVADRARRFGFAGAQPTALSWNPTTLAILVAENPDRFLAKEIAHED